MNRHKVVVVAIISILILSGVSFYIYIVSSDSIMIKRNSFLSWLIIPTSLKDLPDIDGISPTYNLRPGEGNKPESTIIIYDGINDCNKAILTIKDELISKGIRVYNISDNKSAYIAYIDTDNIKNNCKVIKITVTAK